MESRSSWWGQLRARAESAEELAAEEERKRAVIEKLARAIAARRLEAPATLFLELNRPLGLIYRLAAHFARPFLSFFLPTDDVGTVAGILDDPAAFESLLARISELGQREREQ
jgi:hypothetical protein